MKCSLASSSISLLEACSFAAQKAGVFHRNPRHSTLTEIFSFLPKVVRKSNCEA